MLGYMDTVKNLEAQEREQLVLKEKLAQRKRQHEQQEQYLQF